MPNVGVSEPKSLLGMVKLYGEREKFKIYSTIIGIGIDFNTDLIEQITKVRGANYFAVHNNKEFKKKMSQEFKYMVTPLVFNLELNVSTEGDQFIIDQIYGSNEDESTDNKNKTSINLMKVKSLFPSPVNEDNETKGGIIILKIKSKNKDNIMSFNSKMNIKMSINYENKFGKEFKSEKYVSFGNDQNNDYFDNLGIRKGVLLSKYVNICKEWIKSTKDEEKEKNSNDGDIKINEKYGNIFNKFMKYFENEMIIINDKTLYKELEIIKYLRNNGMKSIIYKDFNIFENDNIYYESQEIKTDTCFQHALNHYFQQKYVTKKGFKDLYCKLLNDNKDKIMEIKKLNCKQSFYGNDKNVKIPTDKDLIEASSKILENYDLNGYYELYEMSQIDVIIETLQKNNFKQLSPYDALFLLEFQMDFTNNKLIYCPHRLYHRYERAKDINDQIESKQMFINTLKSNDGKISKAYLSRIESGKSHAFCAIKKDKWILLDSIVQKYGFMKDENEMINDI